MTVLDSETSSQGASTSSSPTMSTSAYPRRAVVLSGIAVVLFMLLLSLLNDSNPFSTIYPNTDSGVFRYIGAHILQGQMPYEDIFDHKGPVMYLINALAAALSTGNLGLYLVECAALITAGLVSYFTALRFVSPLPASAATVFAYMTLGRSLFGGNYVEEYALPLIAIALFCFSTYFLKGRLTLRGSFVIGLTGGMVFLLRPNLLSAWAVFCIVVIVFMVRARELRPLVKTIGIALIGFLCVVVPILLWLYLGGAFPDFIDDYFRFNMEYSATYGNDDLLWTFLWMLAGEPALILVLLADVFLLVFPRKTPRIWWAALLGATVLALLCASMSGRQYEYYLMAWIPFAPMALAALFGRLPAFAQGLDRLCQKRIGIAVVTVAALAVTGVCLIPCILTGYSYAFYYADAHDDENLDDKGGVVDAILTYTDADDQIVVCGADCWAFVETGRSAATRYIFQPEDTRLYIRQEYLIEDIEQNRPKLVVVPTGYDSIDYLDGLPGYSLVFENDSYLVYVLDSGLVAASDEVAAS
jgi:hypothetical protein